MNAPLASVRFHRPLSFKAGCIEKFDLACGLPDCDRLSIGRECSLNCVAPECLDLLEQFSGRNFANLQSPH